MPDFGEQSGATVGTTCSDARLRLLVVCDRPAASQDVHIFRPLRRLAHGGEVDLTVWTEETVERSLRDDAGWARAEVDRHRPEAIIFSRFAGSGVPEIFSAAQACSIPVVTHLDDYLLDVPADLGAAKASHHMRSERRAALRQTLEQADLLYISTQTLAARIRREGFMTPIAVSRLQSCADPQEIRAPKTFDPETVEPVRIGYQGTGSHLEDLRMIAPALNQVMQARPDATFTLFGTIQPPEELSSLGEQLERVAPEAGYQRFLSRLGDLRFDIGLAPLRATEFNSYRTYTKWTEYTAAGCCVVASAGPVYEGVIGNDAGLLVPPGDWADALIALIDNPGRRRALLDAAQLRLRSELSLVAQERQVLDMLARAGVSTVAPGGS